jgi:metal-sulfur cluster biosynthetic enzyme
VQRLTETLETSDRSEHAALEAELRDIVNTIIDPCSAATAVPAGLVDMGLIRELRVMSASAGGLRCHVRLCVTHLFCMMTGVFVNEIEMRLSKHERIGEVEVELDHRTLWTEELMSARYRARLETHRSRASTAAAG